MIYLLPHIARGDSVDPFIPLSLKGEGEGEILKGSALQTSLNK